MAKLNSHEPSGPVDEKWQKHMFDMKLVNPSNKKKLKIIVVGTGLAGASASASLAELGYNVHTFTYHESGRRAHSIAAQGGINAAKNYCNDGDSVQRLFYDTVKGGDFRARESNVHRLAENSVKIIDHCVAQGVPFAREYAGLLDNRSFGGAQVSRTFYAKGQTGQQLLLGAYQAMMKEVERKRVTLHTRCEMMDVVIVNGKARGIIVRNLLTGQLEKHAADAVILATGGYGNVFYLSTNAMACNVTATWKAHKKGAYFANPCYTQIHPTCIPVKGDYQSKLTLMSESLRNDGRVWVPKDVGDHRSPDQIPEDKRDYYLERKYPSFGNLVPRDLASRNAKEQTDMGKGINGGLAVYLDFADAINQLGRETIEARYGNLFDMYQQITGTNPYESPMMIYPAVHYTMGGLWVDYNLQSSIPGLHVLGEANFSDHGANRLGASALMQGLSDGYFVIPNTIGHYFGSNSLEKVTTDAPEFEESLQAIQQKIDTLVGIKGSKTVDHYHRELGLLVWDKCGMARDKKGLEEALKRIPDIRAEFWDNVSIPGDAAFNQTLEKALRVADFLEFGELMCFDALHREESCGGHFRTEHQTKEGEALRNDEDFCFVSAWEYNEGKKPKLNTEDLTFKDVPLSQRSYK
ncbi:MAG: fumarate reductase/succinate dehydrogenase flavoprotein subunit [Candidatus Margulisbacteria bacterium]|nr:fumarate reductase/succinate dehydrogenase flavoprotein subunit [Candidatus Margulisiibacteriota bacterium]